MGEWATGVLISALFPKGEPRQPGTRQITFPRSVLHPCPILGVEVVELTARFWRYVEIKMKTGEKEEGIGEKAKQRRISASDFLFPRSLTLLFLPLSILFDISQRKYENPSGKNAETMTWKGERGLSCGCERYCRALGNACRFQRR